MVGCKVSFAKGVPFRTENVIVTRAAPLRLLSHNLIHANRTSVPVCRTSELKGHHNVQLVAGSLHSTYRLNMIKIS